MSPLARTRSLARYAAFLGPVACGSAALAGCATTHTLADADKVKLEDSIGLEGQMYKDLADDAGVPKIVLRGEAAALYCSDLTILVGSGVPAPDGGLACPKVNR